MIPGAELKKYGILCARMRAGEPVVREGEKLSKPLAAWAAVLDAYSRRDWTGFERGSGISEEEFGCGAWKPLRGDLEFLRANRSFLLADHARAFEGYSRAEREWTKECRLFHPALARYNGWVVRSYAPGFRYEDSLASLIATRKLARGSQDPFVEACVLNSYGNFFYSRGKYARALALYRAALDRHPPEARINNHLDSLGNVARAALACGSWQEADEALEQLNRWVLEKGQLSYRDRFERILAEAHAAREDQPQARLHLELASFKGNELEALQTRVLGLRISLDEARGEEAGALVSVARKLRGEIEARRLNPLVLIEAGLLFAEAELAAGNRAEAYELFRKAGVLEDARRNAPLRSELARIRALLACSSELWALAEESFAEALVFAISAGAPVPLARALRALSRELDRASERWEPGTALREAVVRGVAELRARGSDRMPRSLAAVTTLERKLGGSERVSAVRIERHSRGIVLRWGARSGQSLEIPRQGGKLLSLLLATPDQDVTTDRLFTEVWGCPLRNEADLQKLKTQISRVRRQLVAKKIPLRIESVEYGTYRVIPD